MTVWVEAMEARRMQAVNVLFSCCAGTPSAAATGALLMKLMISDAMRVPRASSLPFADMTSARKRGNTVSCGQAGAAASDGNQTGGRCWDPRTHRE